MATKKEKKVFRFNSNFKNLYFYNENIEFKDYFYETSDEKEAEFLRTKDGIKEITEEKEVEKTEE